LANLDVNVKTVIEEETKVLFNGLVGFDMIKHFYEKNQKCPASVLETAKCLYFLDNSKKKLAVERLESMMELSGLALKVSLFYFLSLLAFNFLFNSSMHCMGTIY
jgi:hypothetical protein